MGIKHEQNRHSPHVAVNAIKIPIATNSERHKVKHVYACLDDVGVASSQCVAQQNASRTANKRFSR